MVIKIEELEFVEVLVPKNLVLEVYQFIAGRTGGNGVSTDDSLETTSPRSKWSKAALKRLYKESAPNMRAILERLAKTPDEVVTATELIDTLSEVRGEEVTSVGLGGTLGAFGRRVKNRHRKDWPFEAWWVEDERQVHYRMDSDTAMKMFSE